MKRSLFSIALVLLLAFLGAVGVFAQQEDSLTLRYDDRIPLSDLLGTEASEVVISDQVVTSFAVDGSGPDSGVLTYADGVVYAVGTGTATMTVDGTSYRVTVEPAKLSLFMITGHSIGAGEAGSGSQSVVSQAGQTYSTFRNAPLTSAEGGLGYGAATRASDTLDAFAPGQGGTKGIGSGLAYQWNQLTGEKVWILNMAVSGSCLNEWQPGVKGHHSTYSYHYDTAVEVYGYAQQILKNEITAGHYTLGQMAIIYHNGANFSSSIYPDYTQASIQADYDRMWGSYQADLALDVDGDGVQETVQALGMIPSWKPSVNNYTLDKAAAYYMSASEQYPDLFIASNATRDMLDEAGLSLFPDITYTTQSKAVYKPESVKHTSMGGTSDNSLFCSVDNAHLSQVTYNYVGMDAADHLYAFLNRQELTAQSLTFQTIDRREISTVTLDVGESLSLAPLADPIWAGNVTFEATGEVSLSYPLTVTAAGTAGGTLSAKAGAVTLAQLTVTATEAAHNHCQCGGYGLGDHICEENITWTPWGRTNTTSLPTESGYYYLVDDIEILASTTSQADTSIHICLNGHNITSASTSARLYTTYGTVTVTDCGAQENWGSVSVEYNSNYGGLFYTYSGSAVRLYAGNFANTGTVIFGGISYISASSVFEIHNANVTGGTAIRNYINTDLDVRDGRGGAFCVLGTLNIYGGTVTGGKAQNVGGNIFVQSGTVNIYGGTVSGGTVDASLGEMTDGETPKGGNIANANGKVYIYGGTVTGGVAAGEGQGGNIAQGSNSLSTTRTPFMEISGGTVTGGTAYNGGNIFVGAERTLTLSGGTVSAGTASNRGGNIQVDDAVLNMTGGALTGGNATTSAGSIGCYNGGTLNLSGGLVEKGTAGTYGGNICAAGKSYVNISGTVQILDGKCTSGSGGNLYCGYTSSSAYVTTNISGGTISNGNASSNGGNCYLDGTATISGGTISDGTAGNVGGNIRGTNRAACTLLIQGGTISGGNAKSGGSIYSAGKIEMTGGTVTGGTATANGGNFYVDYSAKMTLSDGLIEKGSTGASNYGGNVYVSYYRNADTGKIYCGFFQMSGGKLSQGSAYCGGNLNVDGTAALSGGTITSGTATSCGGNVYLNVKYYNKVVYSSMTMSGGLIENGSAPNGGNMQTMADFTMTGGTIRNGKTTGSGGNVRVFRPSTFILDGGTVEGGSGPNGGNFAVSGYRNTTSYDINAALIIKSGLVSGGKATGNGGNIYVQSFADLTIQGGTIENGTANYGGNLYFYPTSYSDYNRDNSLTVTGGVICGGTGNKKGGNIYVSTDNATPSRCALTLSGGQVLDGTAPTGPNVHIRASGDVVLSGTVLSGSEIGIYLEKINNTTSPVPTLTVTGSAVLDNIGADIYLDNSLDTDDAKIQLTVGALDGSDKIIRLDAESKPCQIAAGETDLSAWVIAYDESYGITWSEGAYSLAQQENVKAVAVMRGNAVLGTYNNFSQAAAVAGSGDYVKLLTDLSAEGYDVAGELWLDLSGHTLKDLTVSGTLYGMDSATDDYTDTSAGSLQATVTGSVEPLCKTTTARYGAIRRYMAVENNGAYSFHRFYLGITHMTLKPSVVGMGYKAVFAGSDTVLAKLDSFGYSLWVDAENPVKRTLSSDHFESLRVWTLRVDNVMDPALDAETNSQRAQQDLSSRVFMTLKDGTVIESSVITRNMKEMVETADGYFASYTEAQQSALTEMALTFQDVYFSWQTPNTHHADSQVWTAWTSTSSLPASGTYYLTQDLTISKKVVILANTELTLCLNGHTVTNSTRFFDVRGTLNICDCCANSENQGTLLGNSASLAPIMYTYYGSRVNLYAGHLKAGKQTSQAGVLAIGNDINTYTSGEGEAAFYMYGGSISGGNVTGKGGLISMFHGGTFQMHGGQLYGGTAASNGGLILATANDSDNKLAYVNLCGGTITGGVSGGNGGNIMLSDNAVLNVCGSAQILDGSAQGDGGNIYVSGACTFVLTDGASVSGGEAQGSGGNVYLAGSSTADLGPNTLISDGIAYSCGGNVYVYSTGKLNLDGATLADGYAQEDGGNLAFSTSSVNRTYTLKNGVIRGGTSGLSGGNISIFNSGTYNLENMTVFGGQANDDGGNLRIYRVMHGDLNRYDMKPQVTLTDCVITDGQASDLGGGIYLMGSQLTVSGSTQVTDNQGSNLHLDAGQLLDLSDLASDAKVGVTMSVPGKVTQDSTYASCLSSDDTSLRLTEMDGIIRLTDGTSVTVPEVTGFSAGWARGIVTPTFPVPLDGTGNNVGRMEGFNVVTELEVSMILLTKSQDLSDAILLCSMDTIVIPYEFEAAMAAVISDTTGIPQENIMLVGTHTHAAVSIDENHEATYNYLQWLYPKLAQYAKEAVADLAPVTGTEFIRTDAVNMSRVRRFVDADGKTYSTVDGSVPSTAEPESLVDTEMQAVRFLRDGDTSDHIILVNWQSHPGHDSSKDPGNVSAEMWYSFRTSVEAQLPDTKCAFFIGACGNQTRKGTTDYVSTYGNTYNLSDRDQFGAALAEYLIKALEDPTPINTGAFDIQVLEYAFDTEPWYEDGYKYAKTVDMQLRAVSIGDFAFVTAPYEMFSQNGRQIKEFVYGNDLFKVCFVITNSGGSNKYIAAYESFVNDFADDALLNTFEVESTRFHKGIAEELVTNFCRLLTQLSGRTDVTVPDFMAEAAAKYDQ